MNFALPLGLILLTGGFGYAFALAVQSKRLSTPAILLGATSILCGIGTIPFLAVGWKAVQSATFAAVADGAEPHVAGKRMTRYKMAATATVAGLLILAFAARLPSATHRGAITSDVDVDIDR